MDRRRFLTLIGLAPLAPLAAKATEAAPCLTVNQMPAFIDEIVKLTPRTPFVGPAGAFDNEIRFHRPRLIYRNG